MALQDRQPHRRTCRSLAALTCAAAVTSIVLADNAGPQVQSGLPLDSARFLVNDKPVLRGVFSGSILLDAVSVAEGTFLREEGTLHQIAAVRIAVRRDGGPWTIVSDEELAAGLAPARLMSARDLSEPPATALDALGGFGASSFLTSDGSADVRIDVLFPMGLADDRPGSIDRRPEALLVGPPANGPVSLGAIIGGDIDDPVIADGGALIAPDAMRAGLSGVSLLLEGLDRATPIAIVGFDLDDLGATDGAALGWRLEIPAGVRASIKLLGTGESLTDMLASVEDDDPALALLGGGSVGGGSGSGAPAAFANPAGPAFRGDLFGGGSGFSGGGGGSSGGPSPQPTSVPPVDGPDPGGPPLPPAPPTPPEPPPPAPPVPAPGVLALLGLALLERTGARRRRGQS